MNQSLKLSELNYSIVISGSGGYLPGEPLSNRELIDEYGLDATPEWIRERTGISHRHFAAPEEAASTLGVQAARRALERAALSAQKLDRIIFCSTTADWTSPAAASNIQKELRASCPAEDKQVACAGFIFGVDHALRLLMTGCEHILVVAGEVKSRFVRRSDQKLAPIFADGAGAWVLSRTEAATGGFIDAHLWSDSAGLENILTPAGGSALPASMATVEQELHTVQMRCEGRKIADDAAKHMTELSQQICRRNRIEPDEIDFFIPHQANATIMKDVARRLNLNQEQLISTIGETGNIVTATIPYSYDCALRQGVFEPGMTLLMTTVGAGYAGGALLYRIPENLN